MNNFYIPFLITFLAGISTTIGYFFIYLKPKNVNGFIGFSLAFSGSIMFFISLFKLIPDGFFYLLKEYNLFVAAIVLLGMLVIGNLIINNIQYILKVTDIREKEDFTYIDVDILGYSEELIDSSITNYSNNLIIKTGTIIAQNIDGQLYLSSFALENREDER